MANKRIEIFEFFRGCSILGIVLYHLLSLYMDSLPTIIKYAANVGSTGVLIFFFCSGFGLYVSHTKHQLIYTNFLKKRILKIYIPYMFVVFLSFLVPFVSGGPNRFIGLLSHIFQFRIFSMTYFEAFGGHFWYLGTLFQLYIIFHLTYYLLNKIKERYFLIIAFSFSVAYVCILAAFNLQNNVVLIRLFPKYYIEFALGMIIGKMYLEDRIHIEKISKWCLAVIGIVGLAILGISSMTSFGRLLNDIPGFIGFLSMMIFVYQFNIKALNVVMTNISKISYEWYLLHMLVFSAIFYFSDGTFFMDCLCAVLAFILSLVMAFLYNILNKKFWTKNK